MLFPELSERLLATILLETPCHSFCAQHGAAAPSPLPWDGPKETLHREANVTQEQHPQNWTLGIPGLQALAWCGRVSLSLALWSGLLSSVCSFLRQDSWVTSFVSFSPAIPGAEVPPATLRDLENCLQKSKSLLTLKIKWKLISQWKEGKKGGRREWKKEGRRKGKEWEGNVWTLLPAHACFVSMKRNCFRLKPSASN